MLFRQFSYIKAQIKIKVIFIKLFLIKNVASNKKQGISLELELSKRNVSYLKKEFLLCFS